MKKNKKIRETKENISPLQFIHLIDEQWGFFQETNEIEDKLTHMMNTMTMIFMYMVYRYDHQNYQKYMNKESE
jgi:hypothetical protein